jgi:hypothetical protein
MASIIEMCNRALSRIGVSSQVEDLLDPNEAARQCRQHYNQCRQEALVDFPWAFAQTVVQLAIVSGVTVPGYAYVYRYPTNCLRADVLTDEGGSRVPMTQGYGAESLFNRYDWLTTRRWPFRVMADPSTPGARIIVTDIEDAYLWFTVDVEEPNQMPPAFRSAVSWRLAMELALGLRADQRLAQNAGQQYRLADSVAQAADLNEGQPDAEQIPAHIAVRY